jgi:aminoglycoside phosphotransferase (APT) family kinase protein
MLSRPELLSDDVLTHALGAGWDIRPAAIRYLAVGYGSHHWQVTTAGHGQRWFVSVDDLAKRLRSPADTTDAACGRLRSALLAARALREAGAPFVVAPVCTVDRDVLRRIGDAYAMAVYPFVDGRAREFGDALSPADRRTVLPLIAAVHSAPASVCRHARTDDFLLPGAAVLRRALDDLVGRWDGGPWGEPARRLLARHASQLERLLGRRDQLADEARGQQTSGPRALGRPDRMVLTHGEPHPGNFIQVGPQWMLVDWDTALIAPPERDLWLLDPGDGSVIDAYVAAGREISPPMLDLYRLTWELSDIVGCVTRFRGEHGDSAEDRAEWEILSRSSLGRSS